MGKTPKMKTSKSKIWIRAGIFIFFTILFSMALFNDISSGYFPLWPVPLIFIVGAIFGYWLSRFVPMHVHRAHGVVTFSLDIIYLVLIISLVAAKLMAGERGYVWITDILMVFIIGMMIGRIGGIGLRVRRLKEEHGLR